MSIPSLVGAAAGLILLGSLSAFLSELTGERLRVGGLGLSLIFEAIGVVLLVVGRERRSNTVGVTLAALGVVPLVFFLFFDLPREETLVGGDDVVLTSSIALLVAAALWMGGHLFGPSRSHVLFLGASLVAVWLAITIQVVDEPSQPRLDGFGRAPIGLTSAAGKSSAVAPLAASNAIGDDTDRVLEEYEKYDKGEVVCVDGVLESGDPTFWECEGDSAWPIVTGSEDDFFSTEDGFPPDGAVEGELRFDEELQFDEFDSQFDDEIYSDDYYYDPYQPMLGEWTAAGSRFGWTTLVFGAFYLGCGSLFDRRGDHRRGTAFAAVAAPLTYYGIALTNLGDLWKFGLAYLLAGAAAMYVGAAANRRFTAWLGTLAATGGLIYFVIDVVGEESSGTAFGLTLLVVGLAVAAGAHLLDVNGAGPNPAGPQPGTPLLAGAVAPQPVGPPIAPPPASQWGGSGAPPATSAPSTPGAEPTSTSGAQPTAASEPDRQWMPPAATGPAPGSATPPAFDPRPPGSNDPLPPSGDR